MRQHITWDTPQARSQSTASLWGVLALIAAIAAGLIQYVATQNGVMTTAEAKITQDAPVVTAATSRPAAAGSGWSTPPSRLTPSKTSLANFEARQVNQQLDADSLPKFSATFSPQEPAIARNGRSIRKVALTANAQHPN